jgi:hypothetical protein
MAKSNSSKGAKHAKKMKEKRAKKAARASLYKSYAGSSKKNKRMTNKSQVAGIYKHAHIMADCGNVGCAKCNPKQNA